MTRSPRPAFGTLIFFAIAFALSLYFTFAAVQGDFGLFRRAEILAETQNLRAQLETVRADVARMENLTHRLSDNYLDLDLLDERARKVLGMVRTDEIVINCSSPGPDKPPRLPVSNPLNDSLTLNYLRTIAQREGGRRWLPRKRAGRMMSPATT